jgi:hypothetical protein
MDNRLFSRRRFIEGFGAGTVTAALLRPAWGAAPVSGSASAR